MCLVVALQERKGEGQEEGSRKSWFRLQQGEDTFHSITDELPGSDPVLLLLKTPAALIEPLKDRCPEVVVLYKPLPPDIDGGNADMPSRADLRDRDSAVKVSAQDGQDVEECIGAVRDDEVEEDRMTVAAAAFTGDARNMDDLIHRLTVVDGGDAPLIGRGDLQVESPAGLALTGGRIKGTDGLP